MSLGSTFSSYLPPALTSAFSTKAVHAESLTKDIRITRLRIHPIKSCRGLEVDSVNYDKSGFQYDRTWLIINAESRNFYTARDLPKLVIIEPQVDQHAGVLKIKIPPRETGGAHVTVTTPLDPSPDQIAFYELIEDINIWGAKVNGYAVSNEADDALSNYLGKPVRLVRKGPSLRPSGPHDPVSPTLYPRAEASVNMQDFYPILVATEASFADVRRTLLKSVFSDQSNLSKTVLDVDDATAKAYKIPASLNRNVWTQEHIEDLDINRFRPNIVLGDASSADNKGSRKLVPFEEDAWESFEVFDRLNAGKPAPGFGEEAEGKGKGIYTLVRCGRCMVPNIDPNTGVRDAHLPYRVIIQSRKVDPSIEKPCFGMLSCTREDSGTLHVGDIVRVTRTTDPDIRTMDPSFQK